MLWMTAKPRMRSPRFEAEIGAGTPAAGSGVMGTVPPRHVEEVEEEDPDVPLKRKRTGGSCRMQLVKKPRRQAHTVVVEGEPSAVLPSLAPLVVESSVPEPTTGEVAPDLGKINFVLVIYFFMCSGQLIICFVMQELRR